MEEQHEDDEQREHRRHQDGARSRLLVFKLSAIFQMIAGGQRNLLANLFANVVDHAAQVAAGHVG